MTREQMIHQAAMEIMAEVGVKIHNEKAIAIFKENGIRVEGENRFTVAPRPGGRFTHAKADYVSVYGRVESGWRKTDRGMEFTVTVPANCAAHVLLPDGSGREQGAGTQTYQILEG